MGNPPDQVESSSRWSIDQGFNSSYEERDPIELQVTGDIPDWAAGVLYRTGTGVSEIETADKRVFKVNHWFDGMSVVHRFQILAPDKDHPSVRVFYNSRSACDALIQKIQRTGSGNGFTFGAKYEPCTSYFKKVMSIFRPSRPDQLQPSERAMSVTLSVNFPGLSKTGERYSEGHTSGIQTLANKTDAPYFQMVDPETLEPIGLASQRVLHPDLKGPFSSAHARSDPLTGDVYNYNLDVGRNPVYRVFRVSAATGETSILAAIRGADAAYLHSFFLTKHYVILCVWNSFYAAGGLKIVWTRNIIDALADYDPSRPARWFIIDCRPPHEGGKGLIATYESDPFYCFHTVNCYEEPSTSGTGTDIVADLIAYNNLDCLKQFYISNLIGTDEKMSGYASNTSWHPVVKRFRLPSIPEPGSSTPSNPPNTSRRAILEFQAEARQTPELPTLNPSYVTRPHRYIYGVSNTGESSFLDGLVKFDTATRQSQHWSRDGQTAGEPIFVPRRQSGEGTNEAVAEMDEDDGVLLSVVLDGPAGKSYLLVLDAKTMTEVGRADVRGVIGFGFHGTHVSAFGDRRALDV